MVEQLADRIGIINHGRLISCGTLEALRTQAAVDGPLEDVFLTLTHPEETNGQVVPSTFAGESRPAP